MVYQERLQREMGEESTLFFKNDIQKELWNKELSGQISDGMWENTNNSGYNFWCSVKTELGETTKFEGNKPYYIKTNFGFTRLIQYTGDDMIAIGKKYDPDYNEQKLRKDLQEISKAIKA